MIGKCECSIKGCKQGVYYEKEMNRKYPLCYFHAKVRDGLFSEPWQYTIIKKEELLSSPCSDPIDYEPIAEGRSWND